jgi:hypothetical protein
MSDNREVNISDEAVEILARREYELIADHDDEFPSWDDVVRDPAWAATVRDCRDDARRILEAAAPIIAAVAWDEGSEAEFDRGKFDPLPTNPYRKDTLSDL